MTVTAFDSDVLIYTAQKGNALGDLVWTHVTSPETTAVGSFLLLLEVLAKPLRENPDSRESTALASLMSRIHLEPLDQRTAQLSLNLAVAHKLRAADATHLATAIIADADHFLTNNRKDFPKTIAEIDILYPEDLADPRSTS